MDKRERWARNACPGHGSCGGMFTYNTMQSFIALLGLEPLHMVSPASEDPRRTEVFPEQVVFEPVHGSVPDNAGKGIANPVGAVWSAGVLA